MPMLHSSLGLEMAILAIFYCRYVEYINICTHYPVHPVQFTLYSRNSVLFSENSRISRVNDSSALQSTPCTVYTCRYPRSQWSFSVAVSTFQWKIFIIINQDQS